MPETRDALTRHAPGRAPRRAGDGFAPAGSRSVGSDAARAVRVASAPSARVSAGTTPPLPRKRVPATTGVALDSAPQTGGGRRFASSAGARSTYRNTEWGSLLARGAAGAAVVGLVAGLVVVQFSSRSNADADAKNVVSVTQAGDSPSQLANSASTSIASSLLAEAKPIVEPDTVVVARRLGSLSNSAVTSSVVSSFSSAVGGPTTAAPRVYRVSEGDTLAEIAERYGVSPEIVVRLNELADPSHIGVGQELIIADKVIPRASAAPAKALRAILPSQVRTDPERMKLVPVFRKWARANSLPVDLLMAMCWQESGWDNTARSSVGAMGIGQLMPVTVEHVKEMLEQPDLDPDIAEDNIRMAARYLRYVLAQYEGNEALALVAYYQGPEALATQGLLPGATHYVETITALRIAFAPIA